MNDIPQSSRLDASPEGRRPDVSPADVRATADSVAGSIAKRLDADLLQSAEQDAAKKELEARLGAALPSGPQEPPAPPVAVAAPAASPDGQEPVGAEAVKVTRALKKQAAAALDAELPNAKEIVDALASVEGGGNKIQFIIENPQLAVEALKGLPNDATPQDIYIAVGKKDGVQDKAQSSQDKAQSSQDKAQSSQDKAQERADLAAEKDKLLSRLRELNPEFANKADAEYVAYAEAKKKENAALVAAGQAPVEPMDKRGFLIGAYAVGVASGAFLAGVSPDKRDEAKAGVDALRQMDEASVSRFMREVAPSANRTMVENALEAGAKAAGVDMGEKGREKVGEKTDKDGVKYVEYKKGDTVIEAYGDRTVYRGKDGGVVEETEGRVVTYAKDGTVLSRVSGQNPTVSRVGRMGYPVSNLGKDAGAIQAEVKSAKGWDEFMGASGFGFAPSGMAKLLEGHFRRHPPEGGSFTLAETGFPPTFAQKRAVAESLEKLIGMKKGEMFDPGRGFVMRESFKSSLGGIDPQVWVRNRFFNGWGGEGGKHESGPGWNGSLDPSRTWGLLGGQGGGGAEGAAPVVK